MRFQFEITEKVYERAIELIERDEVTISHDRRTELFFEAMDEYPNEDKEM